MPGITEKLYPPIISGTLPAFYKENTDQGAVCKITVPFSMNRAVNTSDIGGFSLKLKTVQSNSLVADLNATMEATTEDNNRYVEFTFNNIDESKIKLGQFLKAQMAYKDQNGITGYYSTVGIIKYTSKPNVYIKGYETNTSNIKPFQTSYTGVYEPTEDKTERPYSYRFSLYDNNEQLIETSDWLIHNTSINNVASESLSLEQTTDTYSFNSDIAVNNEYRIIYQVRTINNLELSSGPCLCSEPQIGPPPFQVNLNAENNFEEGYIRTYFTLKNNNQNLTINNPVSIELCRAEKTDNYSSWKVLKKEFFENYDYAVNYWEFKDFTVEQGVTYKYCFRQYNKNNIQSDRSYSNEVVSDFEDMFLWDGEKQVKIRFNPQVSSFKTNHLEQKSDTIGSRYPFIFRNGVVDYKEFPISGLISYLLDNNEMFINHQEDLNIILGTQTQRVAKATPVNQTINDTNLGKSWELSETLDSVGYNMIAERRFKLKLLEWLGDGKTKLFKSPAEGNYFVKLLNISLSPETRLSRMLHTFSCTAYEVEEFNYNNLIKLHFLDPQHQTETYIAQKTVYLKDFIDINKISVDYGLKQVIQINDQPIFEYIGIVKSQNSLNKPVYIRFGPTEKEKRELEESSFSIYTKGKELSNIYFCLNDHLSLLEQEDDTLEKKVNRIKNIIGDTQITYRYYTTNERIGKLYNIKDIYLRTYVTTFIGETNNPTITFNYASPIISSKSNNITEEKTIKFLTIDIHPKKIKEIYYDENNNLYYKNYEDGIYKDQFQTSDFDDTTIYKVYKSSSNNENYFWLYHKGNTIFSNKNDINKPFNPQITLINGLTSESEIYNISDIPVHLNLDEQFYSSITVNKFAYIDYSYQNRVVTYGE